MAENVQLVINASKIPGTIKMLPTFDGDKKMLTTWLTQADEVMNSFQQLNNAQNRGIYRLWLGAVRAKIIGEANEYLANENVGLNWDEIKEKLIHCYSDKRDLSTLIQNIPYLQQGQNSIDEFYNEVTHLQSLVGQRINLDSTYAGHSAAVIRFVCIIIMNSFIDGLIEPYSTYTRNYKPKTITDAYHAAKEQYFANLRKNKKLRLARDNKSKEVSESDSVTVLTPSTEYTDSEESDDDISTTYDFSETNSEKAESNQVLSEEEETHDESDDDCSGNEGDEIIESDECEEVDD